MARIVAAMAMTHSPGLTGWFDRAPKSHQTQALQAMTEMRERLAAARPDVIVAFSNDHLLNWPINNTPEYTVGIDAEHEGPRTGTTSGWRSTSTRSPAIRRWRAISSTRGRGGGSRFRTSGGCSSTTASPCPCTT
jgi:hypothetical protein